MTAALMRLALLCACGLAVGCGDRAPDRPAANAAASATPAALAASTATPAAAAAASIESRITPGGPVLTFALHTAPGNSAAGGVLQVRSIDIRAADGSLLQRIEGLDTQTPWSELFRGLEVVDLNFDGSADLRLVESQPAGPDLPYRNWRYETATGRFVAAPELDVLPGLQIDAAARELRSSWRAGPTDYGIDVWTYRDAQLVPLRRERRHYSAPGRYTLEVSQPAPGGSWNVIERRQGRDE